MIGSCCWREREAVLDSLTSTSSLSQFDMSSRKEPLSVEAILQKQKEAAQIKVSSIISVKLSTIRTCSPPSSFSYYPQPKFLTKAERQAQALEKRKKEVDESKQKEENGRKEREELERKSREQARINATSNFNARQQQGGPGREGYDNRCEY